MEHVTSVDPRSTADNEFSLARAASLSYLGEGLPPNIEHSNNIEQYKTD